MNTLTEFGCSEILCDYSYGDKQLLGAGSVFEGNRYWLAYQNKGPVLLAKLSSWELDLWLWTSVTWVLAPESLGLQALIYTAWQLPQVASL